MRAHTWPASPSALKVASVYSRVSTAFRPAKTWKQSWSKATPLYVKRIDSSLPGRRPRMRCCLLKGCEQRFHPRQARQRYCSEECRKAARKWERWKAQQRYRETAAGKQRRNGQSRRYRERVKSGKPPEPEAVDEAARVITTEHFFRLLLRPARLL